MFRFVQSAGSLFLVASALAACGRPPAADTSQSSAPLPGSYVVVDALGREVRFAQPPQRIVLAGKALWMIADALYMFPGAARRIVATGKTGQGSFNFVALIDPSIASKIVFSDDPGPELVAAARPDLVVLKSYLAQGLGRAVESLGIPVLYLDLETPEQYFRDILTLGRLMRQDERGQQLVAYYRSRGEQIRNLLGALKDSEKPQALVIYHSDREGKVAFNVPPAEWMQTRIVEMAGGTPVWTHANLGKNWTTVSLEQILLWNPEVIFLVSYARNPTDVVKELKSDPTWQHLRAVKSNRIHAFPADFYGWDQPSPRWILGLTWAAQRLYPDRLSTLDVISAAEDFYHEAYGLDGSFFRSKVRPIFRGELP